MAIPRLHADDTLLRPGRRPGTGSVWYFRQGRFVAVDALSDPRAYMTGKLWLEQGVTPRMDQLADPAVDLKEITLAGAEVPA